MTNALTAPPSNTRIVKHDHPHGIRGPISGLEAHVADAAMLQCLDLRFEQKYPYLVMPKPPTIMHQTQSHGTLEKALLAARRLALKFRIQVVVFSRDDMSPEKPTAPYTLNPDSLPLWLLSLSGGEHVEDITACPLCNGNGYALQQDARKMAKRSFHTEPARLKAERERNQAEMLAAGIHPCG